jgi:hypothetical protein
MGNGVECGHTTVYSTNNGPTAESNIDPAKYALLYSPQPPFPAPPCMRAYRGIAGYNGRTISSCSGGRSLYIPLCPAPTCTLGGGWVVKLGEYGELMQVIGWLVGWLVGWLGAWLGSPTHPL